MNIRRQQPDFDDLYLSAYSGQAETSCQRDFRYRYRDDSDFDRSRFKTDSYSKIALSIVLIVAILCILFGLLASIDISTSVFGGNESVSDVVAYSANATSSEEPKSTPRSEWRRGEVPILYQIDKQWSQKKYGEETLGDSGCGPTCLSMVYIGLTGKTDKDPVKMCRFSEKRGYFVEGKTSWELMTSGASALGLDPEELPADESIIMDYIEKGHPIIASVGPGTFTTSGHFIVLCGSDTNGNVIIHDPNSLEYTNRTWNLSEIMPQFRNIWAYSR